MIPCMEEVRVHLMGLLPPDNVVRALTEVKRGLFHAFSIVSGLALDAILPLAYLPEPPGAPNRDTLPPCPPFVTGNWQIADGNLFLSIAPTCFPGTLLDATGLASPAEGMPSGAIPLYPGLYIARIVELPRPVAWSAGSIDQSAAKPPDPRRVVEYLGPPPRLGWTASQLACWTLRYRDPGRWWEAVFSEQLWTVRLKKDSGSRRL